MSQPLNSRLWEIRTCDVLEGLRSLPDKSVHCVVTSPPYFALRDYGVDGQIGLERTPEQYVAKMVKVFGEVRRVMRDDATLWLNIGDSYAGSGKGGNPEDSPHVKQRTNAGTLVDRAGDRMQTYGLKPKDLIGIPWMLAFALRADGWYLRSEIIWHKRSPMPESVQDRPTKAHEQVFLLSKSSRYFYDVVASAEKTTGNVHSRGHGLNPKALAGVQGVEKQNASFAVACKDLVSARNMRSVWPLSSEPFPGAHFATYPTELVRRCLLAGTSEKGCCATCGALWRRMAKKERRATRPGLDTKSDKYRDSPEADSIYLTKPNLDPQRHVTKTVTVGWKPGCDHGGEPVPCLVLDPFAGAGTTIVVARRMQLRAIGLELNPDYAEMARARVRDDSPLFNSEQFEPAEACYVCGNTACHLLPTCTGTWICLRCDEQISRNSPSKMQGLF